MARRAARALIAAVIAGYASALPAWAQQVMLDGTFVAERTCAATRKKDRDNPGNVRLQVGQHYDLIARNATPGTHYRIVVPGAPSETRRWVPMTCGSTDGRTQNTGSGSTLRIGGLKQNAIEHVLAASWQPGFCATRPNLPECRSFSRRQPAARQFSLHGLWPDDLDDRAIFPCYCNTGQARSCSLKLAPVDRLTLSDSVRAQLRAAMPGMRSGLHRHEWTKHGTCYEQDRTGSDQGSDADEYFVESLALLEQLNASGVRDLFADAIGKRLTAAQIRKAFDRAFGNGSGERVIVRCADVSGSAVITELWISLGAGVTPDSGIADLIRAAPPAARSSNARRCNSGLVADVGR